ncbi:metallophosphoesterase family protein [Clostridium beijerinckii]|jgi:Predicted phosphoesterase|uniref:Metallophosphoesterase family protein n=2 Tax=Clostridium beijerinckii TaxID=1520 RepID=A0AAE2RPJ7_CLOBE|nr:metallophosphoesterase family protein [Clostridium beijerinckii]ABR36055.1 metallophosphoesterase [Clostridium beijerinckii NCIMB 8052]AIU02788.1 metallophosphoesterase [Clostridium beijerinckii ATCC 35702]MBF7809300.1 metallophosphoesterase family protein [Clostridium beijerinckii]NRT22892.1 putative phosphoesterase [Clostridium beijerinckii]NRT69949.1 putative phosphoesterase [Clostridium beijerinckii]
MIVAVLSDIHGNGVALKYTIRDLKELGISKIIILGDVVMKGPMPSEVLKLLNDEELEVLTWIKGNTDMWFKEFLKVGENLSDKEKQLHLYYKYSKKYLSHDQVEFIDNLPLESSIILNNIEVLCVHGTPKSIVEAIDGTVHKDDIKKAISGVKERLILCGHSHSSFIGEVDGKKIFNVGSVGNSLDGDNRISYGILEFLEDEVKLINRRIEYPVNEIIDIAIKNKFPFIDQYRNCILNAR